MKKERSTITDVAKAAGVAVGTVSRVFNHFPDVDPEIQKRVWQASKKLNYRRIRETGPRGTSKKEKTRAGNIAVICFGMDDSLVNLPIVSSALQGIEHALSSHHRSLMLATIPKGDRVPPFLTEGDVDGLILKGPNQGTLPPADHPLLQAIYRLPHVWMMGRLPGAQGDHCNFDTDIAGRLAAEHLHAKGHQRVAFFNPKPGQVQFEKLKTSFQWASELLGCTYSLLEIDRPNELTWPLPAITQVGNVAKLVAVWEKMPLATRPTAIFSPSDRTSIQLYSALEDKGLRAGKDVSIVSCNNEQSLASNLQPALSTIDVHAEAIGRRAVEQLLWRIEHPKELLPVQVLIEPVLVERNSVALMKLTS